METSLTPQDALKNAWVKRVLGIELWTTNSGRPQESAAAPTGTFSKVAFEKLHLEWESSKKLIEQRLASLHAEIVVEFADPEGETAAGNLSKVLAELNRGLGHQLDGLRQAETPEARMKFGDTAREIARSYLEHLASDPLVRHVEANPFDVVVDAPAVLGGPLRKLESELARLGL